MGAEEEDEEAAGWEAVGSCAAVCLMEDASDVALEEEAALEELLSAEVLDAEALSAASSEAAASSRGGLFLCDELDDRGKFTVAGVGQELVPCVGALGCGFGRLDTSEGSAAMDTERNILSTETAGIATATATHIPTAAAMREINFFFIE